MPPSSSTAGPLAQGIEPCPSPAGASLQQRTSPTGASLQQRTSPTGASLQQRIVRLLADCGNAPGSGLPFGYTHLELAKAAYDVERPTRSQLSAVRRAVAALVAAGRAKRVGRADPYEERGA